MPAIAINSIEPVSISQMTKSGNGIVFAWFDTKEKTIKTASLLLN